MVLHHRGFPIRKSAGQRLFPPNRGLSQVITSFIGSQCQGIHLTLFFAWTAFCLFSILENKISFFCLSFANNCCLGCKLKDHCSCNSLYVRFNRFLYQSDEIVSSIFILLRQTIVRKNHLVILSNKFFSMILFFKRINIQLSVSFLLFLFGFQWTFALTPTRQ